MTIVIADTSPINYLILIGEIEILHALYERVLIPTEVFDELTNQSAPLGVRQWTMRPPGWLDIQPAPYYDRGLVDLDVGEAAAIALAEAGMNVLLLMDESAGRREASRRGIANTGTLGVLRTAAIAGLVELPTVLNRLTSTNFRVSKSLISDLLQEDAERRREHG